MADKKSKLPMETRPIRLSSDLAEYVEGLLGPLEGKELEAAQQGILKMRSSGLQGTSEQLRNAYRDAVAKALGRDSEDG